MEKPFTLPQLDELQVLREAPVIVYHAAIENDAVRTMYECLRHIGAVPRLNLVLFTSGGVVTTARRLALLLREFTQHLTILVPYQVKSAGTLLCLSANDLVLGPMAELGPIDAHINSTGPSSHGVPDRISAEDVRVFRQMAEDWFGVKREKDRLQVLALVAQRMFPTSLSSFYRSDKLTRQAAYELLHYQLPDVEDDVRLQIANQLVSGYNAHDHIITRAEARALGLQVRFPSSQEETLLWNLAKTLRKQFLEPADQSGEEGVVGVIMSTHFCARHMYRLVDASGAQRVETEPEEAASSQSRNTFRLSWEMHEE